MYGRTEKLKALFPGVIISLDTPPQERGVKVLGSILRNSHKDYIKVCLEHMLREAINTYALPASSPQPSRPLPHHAQVVHAKVHASAKPLTRIRTPSQEEEDPNIFLVERAASRLARE